MNTLKMAMKMALKDIVVQAGWAKEFIRYAFVLVAFVFFLAMNVSQVWAQAESEQNVSGGSQAVAEEEDAESETDLMAIDWLKQNPTGSKAEFEVPVEPRYRERTLTPVIGVEPVKLRTYMATPADKKSTFVFNYHDMHEIPKGAEIAKTLDGAVRISWMGSNGQLVNEPQAIKLSGSQGRQFVYVLEEPRSKKEYIVISRVFLRKQRMYQVSAVMEKPEFDELVASRFLNSLKFVAPKSDLPPVPKFRTE